MVGRVFSIRKWSLLNEKKEEYFLSGRVFYKVSLKATCAINDWVSLKEAYSINNWVYLWTIFHCIKLSVLQQEILDAIRVIYKEMEFHFRKLV